MAAPQYWIRTWAMPRGPRAISTEISGEEVLPMRRRVITTVAILAAFYLGWWLHGFINIDQCLDAGGVWDDRHNFCRHLD